MRLRQAFDFRRVDGVAIDPLQVVEDDIAAERQQAIEPTRSPRRCGAISLRQRHG